MSKTNQTATVPFEFKLNLNHNGVDYHQVCNLSDERAEEMADDIEEAFSKIDRNLPQSALFASTMEAVLSVCKTNEEVLFAIRAVSLSFEGFITLQRLMQMSGQ